MPCEVPSLSFSELSSHPVASPEGSQKIYFLNTGTMYVRGTGAPQLFLASQGVTDLAMTLLAEETAGEMLTTLGVSAFVQTIFNDASAAAVRTTIGAAASGVNSDITTLDALASVGSPVNFVDSITFASAITLQAELFDSISSPGADGDTFCSNGVGTEWRQFLTISGPGGPTITGGTAVPVAAEPDGSIYLRTDAPNGSLYVMQNGVWTLK